MINSGVQDNGYRRPRILLRTVENQLYYSSPGDWVLDPDQAYDFVTVREAIRCLQNISLDHAEVVFSYNDPQLDSGFRLNRSANRQQRLEAVV